MTYASRVMYDADSHLMETPAWLVEHADPPVRDAIGEMSFDGAGGEQIRGFIASALARIEDAEQTRELEANVIASAKGWHALGAIDAAERRRALDLLGFDGQLVFSTFSSAQFLRADDLDVVYGGARAHNRGMGEFCGDDPRLLGVGVVPLHDPRRAVACAGEALDLGCSSVWIASDTPGDFSPAHVDLEPLWSFLASADVPFMLHIGGGRLLHKAYHNNGRPKPTDWLGGGENLRGKDFPVVHHSPERFLTCLVLDGVFDRNENLRCGVIEQGASWVPGMLRNLDHACDAFTRTEPLLRDLELAPSEYVRRQVRFTPFPFEDIGWLVDQAGPDLFLFSTDYPHPEGGRHPIERFEASLDAHDISDGAREMFYADNFRRLVGI